MGTDRIIVTAATGNIGRPLVKALQYKDMNFEAATRDTDRAREQLGRSLDTVYLDYEEPSGFNDALSGNDLLFLCGPSATPNAAELVKPMVDAAENQGISHIVFIASHPTIVDSIQESGIDYTFIKTNFFMQNFELYQTEEIRERKRIFLPCGRGKAAFIRTRDIGEVAGEILADPAAYRNETVDLTGPQAIDLYDAAAIFSEVMDCKIKYANPDNEEYRKDRKERGFADEYIDAMISVFGKIKKGDAAEMSPAVEQILDRKPLSLNKYVEEQKALFQSV